MIDNIVIEIEREIFEHYAKGIKDNDLARFSNEHLITELVIRGVPSETYSAREYEYHEMKRSIDECVDID